MTIDHAISGSGIAEDEAVSTGEPQRKIEGRSPWRLAYERLRRDRAAVISLVVIGLIVLLAILAPVVAKITTHGVNEQFYNTGLTPEGLPKGPSGSFVIGNDDLGRDLLVRIAYGARISLFVGVVATALAMSIGVVVGLAAGYFGKIVDTILARF